MKKDNVFFITLLIIIICLTCCLAFLAFKKEEKEILQTDAMKFKEEYALLNDKVDEEGNKIYPNVLLEDDNSFVFSTEDEIIELLEKGTGIIYFGYTNCYQCRNIVPILESVAKELGVEQIKYLDISNIRDTLELDENDKIVTTKEGSNNYYQILKILDDYLNDYTLIGKDGKEILTNEKRLYAPTVVGIRNGEIVGFYENNTFKNEELTNEEKETIKNNIKEIFNNVLNEETKNE